MKDKNREVKERKKKVNEGKVFYVSEEVLKEIYDIYQSHDCEDDSACEAEDRLGEFMMRLKSEKSYTEEELMKAAKGGAENERLHIIRKLHGIKMRVKNDCQCYCHNCPHNWNGDHACLSEVSIEEINTLIAELEAVNKK